ncbi:MAG: lipid A export permease/ATP-binding protein MsbA [Gammaproteobacteria bacterium]|nr:MAG: lipid A export permease/ATP-binding protein MsbA [Gammaproteobacteria bacterium]TLZ40849.1 MAG: lipid A export permease/ATP-binding protein MsbA [Gammaproteobacteria bacterium]
MRAYRRLLGYLRPHRGRFLVGILGGVLFSATMASFALLAKKFGDGTFTHQDPRTIVWVPLALVALFVLRGLGDFTQTYFMGYVGRQIVSALRRQVFRRVLQLPIGFFDRGSSAALLSRLTFNTEQIGQAATDSVIVVVRTALTIIGSIGFLLWLNVRLTLVALTMGPLVGWLVSVINRRFRRYSRRIQESMGDITRVAKESLEAPRLIKVYNAEEHLARQFDAVNAHNVRSNMKLILTKGISNPTVQLVTVTGFAFVLSIAIADAIHARMSMGDLLGFLTALVSIAQPLRELVGVAGPLQQGIAAAQSLFELLDEPTEPQGGALRVARARGAVEFDRVSFAYAEGGAAAAAGAATRRAAALIDVSLKVAAGESLAIVGRSGSGKSTLVNLLPRFYDASAGSVRIDGRDVRDYELANLRAQIAVVTQDVVLFDDTIRNNIAFGRQVPHADIERAARAAHVLEFVRDQPGGLDALVGERGVLLSGGQRQRIAIARALLKDAPILILDEATSALDTEAERHIQAALAQLLLHRTTFIIAHRLSTVEQADRIIVLDAGAIVESGTHVELLARGGLYAQLHRLQFSA